MPNSPPEIQNHCTPEGQSRAFLAAIPKFTPEIRNHCTQEGQSRAISAAIPKFTPSIQESLQRQSQNAGNLCSDSQVYPLKSRITAATEPKRGKSLQRFPNSPHEIENHCTLEDVSRQNHAVIPKFTPSNQESLHAGWRF